MNVNPDEFLPAREASRSLGRAIADLQSGAVEKFVIVNRNHPQAVLMTVERYADLVDGGTQQQ